MTDTQMQQPMTPKEAKAAAKAAKAYAKATRPFYRKPWFILVGLTAAIIAIIVIATSGGTSTPDAADGKADDNSSIAMGEVADSGDFEFVATGIEYKTKIGDQYMSEKAQGQFALLSIEVTNTGDEQEYLMEDSQVLVDAEGNEYGTTSAAVVLDEASLFLEQINPGNTVKGVLVYDIPKDVTPTGVQFVGPGLMDGEVEVSLN